MKDVKISKLNYLNIETIQLDENASENTNVDENVTAFTSPDSELECADNTAKTMEEGKIGNDISHVHHEFDL